MSLVDAVADEMRRLGSGVSVRCVHIRVGPLSGVVPEALSFAFDVASADSLLAGATLAIERTAGRELELRGIEVVDAADAADR